MSLEPLVCQGLLIIEDSESCSNTPHLVGLLWKSGHPNKGTSNLTTHNIHNRQITMHPAGFKPTILASQMLQNYALDIAATGVGSKHNYTS
jgi:hypothetical protein